jgi:ribosomal protein S18 acetylase RimI-like enzyme
MNLDELLSLSDSNLTEFCREQCRFVAPFHIEEDGELLLTASGTRFPAGPSNCVVPLGKAELDPDAVLTRARAWYRARGRGFSVYVRAHRDAALGAACERAGYAQMGNSPGMVLTNRLADRDLGDGVVIRKVDGEEAVADFVRVSAAAFESIGMPPDASSKILSCPERLLLPHWRIEVLYQADEPVAAAALLFSHGIAGIYWVGCIESARGRGHGDAIMRSISNHGFDRGAPAVVLQASPFGEPLYRKLGYREITRYPWYLVRRESAE